MSGVPEKEAGNAAFIRGEFEKAIQHYTAAIAQAPADATYYSNRAAAYSKINKTTLAIADAQKCVALAPDWHKGYFRLGEAYAGKGLFARAKEQYERALELCPESDERLVQAVAWVDQKLQAKLAEVEEKRLWKGMEKVTGIPFKSSMMGNSLSSPAATAAAAGGQKRNHAGTMTGGHAEIAAEGDGGGRGVVGDSDFGNHSTSASMFYDAEESSSSRGFDVMCAQNEHTDDGDKRPKRASFVDGRRREVIAFRAAGPVINTMEDYLRYKNAGGTTAENTVSSYLTSTPDGYFPTVARGNFLARFGISDPSPDAWQTTTAQQQEDAQLGMLNATNLDQTSSLMNATTFSSLRQKREEFLRSLGLNAIA